MNDEEIEKAILFYIIFQKEQFDITEKDFVNPIHKKIIQAVNRLIQKKQEITMLTVKNEMNDSSKDILA